MPVVLRHLGQALGLLAWLVCPIPAFAGDDAPDWELVSLPGGRAAFLPQIGMAADVPVALVTGEVLRVLYGARHPGPELLARVRSYFAVPREPSTERIPVPMPIAKWQDLLGPRVTDANAFSTILLNRRAALLCFGLLQLDRETLATVTSDAGLLRRLYERHAGVFAAFADVLHVRDGRLEFPGGEAYEAVWAELVGTPLTDPILAIGATVEADNGRLLYFADAVAALDAAGRGLVFRGATAKVTPAEQARSVYRAFTRVEPNWKLGEFPFVRLGADPALMLPMMRVDAASGRLRHTQAFWEAALSDRPSPADFARRWAQLDAGDRAEPGWLLRHVTEAPLPQRVERLQIFAYAERLIDQVEGATPATLAWLVRAFRRYPALMLTLERLAITDADVLTRMATLAGRVTGLSDDPAAREIGLALFQAPLVLVTRARQSRALDDDEVRALVDALSQIEPTRDGYGRSLTTWVDTALLPALNHDPSIEGASAEATLLEAVAGLRATVAPGPPVTVLWETLPYRVDMAAPELARLADARGLQGGNTLDTALSLCRLGSALARSDRVDQARHAAEALAQLRPLLAPIESSERTTAPPPSDLAALTEQAARELALIKSRNDLKRIGDIASRLARAGDAALADVLSSIVYAIWLGDTQGQPFLAGNVARRHDYGVSLPTGSARAETPWAVPLETSGDGEPWHLRGALLGLDVGLARLALRRTRSDRPDEQPTLNDSDRRTLVLGLALTNPNHLDSAAATELAAWLREGREIAATPERLAASVHVLDLDGRRRQAIAWAARHTAADVGTLLMRTELALLGRPAGARVPVTWGAAETPLTGCLCLQFPSPPAMHRFAGRAGAGLLTSRSADLKLRVLEELHHRKLPAELMRGVLASALQDYLDEARPLHGDDWFTLYRHVDRMAAERFDDYIAALTAGGPLVPLAPEAAPTNERP